MLLKYFAVLTCVTYANNIFVEGGFTQGAACNPRNTAYLNPSKALFPSEQTKCIDITAMGNSLVFNKNWPISNADTLYADHMYLRSINTTMLTFMPNLEFLDFTGNNIKRIPRNISTILQKLTTLLLPNNHIWVPRKIPLMKSESLRTLMLSHNEIQFLRTMTFVRVPSLRILYLDSNYLKFITPKMFSCLTNLKYLHLGNNLLRRVPPKSAMPKSLSFYIVKGNIPETREKRIITIRKNATSVP